MWNRPEGISTVNSRSHGYGRTRVHQEINKVLPLLDAICAYQHGGPRRAIRPTPDHTQILNRGLLLHPRMMKDGTI